MVKRKYFHIFVVSLVLVVFFFLVSAYPYSSPNIKDDKTFRLTTANIYYKNTNSSLIAEKLTSTLPDVLLILEYTGNNIDKDVLRERQFKIVLDAPGNGAHGVLVAVRKDLKTSASLLPSPIIGPCQLPLATLRIPLGDVNYSILGVHAPPPVSACENTRDPYLLEIANWIQGGQLNRDIGPGEKGDHVLVMGDLNVLPFTSSLKEFIKSGLIDSYDEVNFFPGATWSPFSWTPAIARIDYIFVSRNLDVSDSWVIDLPGSDHQAVVTDIKIK